MISERRKVLFLLPSLSAGGAERVFTILLRHLDRSLFELHLAVLQVGGAYLEEIPKDVCIHDLRVSRARHSLPCVIRLAWKLRPRTMLSTLGHLNLALILAKPLLPPHTRLLVRETTILSTFLREATQHPQFWGRMYRYLYRRADLIICSSDTMLKDAVEHFRLPREKLVRIYNPVDVERLRGLAEIGGSPYNGPGPQLVAAGRLSREKGFDVLLEAMPVVLSHVADAQLTILGEGPLQAELTERVRVLGLKDVVRFCGFQENPWRYLKHADLFVLASRFEGLPNVLLEALALGTPVVATDCPGAMREIQDLGAPMILVPREDPTSLAEAIVSICGKRNREFRKIPLETLRKFDLHQAVAGYSSVI